MLVTKVKPQEELLDVLPKKVFVIHCLGCKEVFFPLDEARKRTEELGAAGVSIVAEQMTDYLCRPDYTEKRLGLFAPEMKKADGILVFSCGVGIQTVAELAFNHDKIPVFTGCDTINLSGYSGLRPTPLDCVRCGECVLGLTGGICPVANCAKGLLNGPCGGAMDGKCEVDSNKDCIWLLIYKRLKDQGRVSLMKKLKPVRDYTKAEEHIKW
jgi:electron transport complex protein RnfC